MAAERRWAPPRLGRATSRLERNYGAAGQAGTLAALKGFLGDGGRRATAFYEEVARALGLGVAAVETLTRRLRRGHAHLVRGEVARTALDPAQVDAAVDALCEALIAAGGCVWP